MLVSLSKSTLETLVVFHARRFARIARFPYGVIETRQQAIDANMSLARCAQLLKGKKP